MSTGTKMPALPGLHSGKYWCNCVVFGCFTSDQKLNQVQKRTFFRHKKQQAISDKQKRARHLVHALAQPSIHSGNSSAVVLHASDSDSFDMDMDSIIEPDLAYDSYAQMVVQSDGQPSSGTAVEGDNDDSEESDGSGDADSEFGADVEPQPILDADCRVLVGPDDGHDDPNELTSSQMDAQLDADDSGATDAVLGLAYSEHPAGLLLAFYGSIIQPCLVQSGLTIPRQLGTVRTHLGLDPRLISYAVCPACEELEVVLPGSDELTLCLHCQAPIYERRGKPKILFLYQPLTAWLTWVFQQRGFEDALHEWRDREPSSYLRDVQDGQAWLQERDHNNRPYTEYSYSLMGALGIDWFSPFRSQYTSWHSTGGIMMTLLNLPERLRYHPSMTYLAGCTPGPKEPSATRVGSYMKPLLDELQQLAVGKYIPTFQHPEGKLVRLHVAFFCGDSVGRNKICGFPTHSVKKGLFCGYCDVTFSSKVDAFETTSTIPRRSPQQHRQDSLRLAEPFATKASRTRFERQTGARPSPLNQLSYWTSVNRAPVDHMHNLELGLVKRMFHRTLIEGKTLTPSQLQQLQASLSTAQVPPSEQAPDKRLGDPGGGSATAAHWSTLGRRLLVLLLFAAWRPEIENDDELEFLTPPPKPAPPPKSRSPAAAHTDTVAAASPNQATSARPSSAAATSPPAIKVRARDVLRNAAQLAGAVCLAARRKILPAEIDNLDQLLRGFGKEHAKLFGNKWVVYNSHIAIHIPDHIRRFGPAYHFSAYHFERMNGQLAKISTNGHRNGEVEATYTKAFLTSARSALLLSEKLPGIGESLSSRAPPFQHGRRIEWINSTSTIGVAGIVTIELGEHRSFELPLPLHSQLHSHVKRSWKPTNPPLLAPSAASSVGVRILPRMQQHKSMRFGHVVLSGTGSRANANRSRTFAVVDGRDGQSDLFHISAILSHTIKVNASAHTTVFVLGKRAQRTQIRAFEDALDDPLLRRTLGLFWTMADAWHALELLPAHLIRSDAALVHAHGLTGVSPGEDQRQELQI